MNNYESPGESAGNQPTPPYVNNLKHFTPGMPRSGLGYDDGCDAHDANLQNGGSANFTDGLFMFWTGGEGQGIHIPYRHVAKPNLRTEVACHEAISQLVLGDRASKQNRINPEPGVTYISLHPDQAKQKSFGRITFCCRIFAEKTKYHDNWYCVLNTGSVRMTCWPSELQAAFEYVKGWMLR